MSRGRDGDDPDIVRELGRCTPPSKADDHHVMTGLGEGARLSLDATIEREIPIQGHPHQRIPVRI